VPIYDGTSGAKVGDCCGLTTLEIINCAKQYLE